MFALFISVDLSVDRKWVVYSRLNRSEKVFDKESEVEENNLQLIEVR